MGRLWEAFCNPSLRLYWTIFINYVQFRKWQVNDGGRIQLCVPTPLLKQPLVWGSAGQAGLKNGLEPGEKAERLQKSPVLGLNIQGVAKCSVAIQVDGTCFIPKTVVTPLTPTTALPDDLSASPSLETCSSVRENRHLEFP